MFLFSTEISEWTTIKEIPASLDARAEVDLSVFKPNQYYQLRIIALNRISMSPYSEPTPVFKSPAQIIDPSGKLLCQDVLTTTITVLSKSTKS